MADEPDSGLHYDAFISYDRKADDRLAPALHKGLQTFAKPWYRKRAMEIFRDDTGLGMTPALWPSIEDSLARSRR